jgi:Domain of unknown function (DUF4785) central domain/Domain of unknown function (DUF4785) C-terminal domain/Domain of unknown function (DUF4785) N-terminal domain
MMSRGIIALVVMVVSSQLLASGQVYPYECKNCPPLSQQALQAQWAIEDKPLIQAPPTPVKSASWKKIISGADLLKGISIDTFGPQAVIRLSPLQANAVQGNVSPLLYVRTESGEKASLQERGQLLAADSLPLGAEAAAQTVVWQIEKSLGNGRFIFFAEDSRIDPKAQWQVSVYDKWSSLYLQVETDKTHYQLGDTLTLTAALLDDSRYYPIDRFDAYVETPLGKSYPVTMEEVKPQVYKGTLRLRDTQITQGENWNIEVLCHLNKGDKIVVRHAHTVFSYSVPSARIASYKAVSLQNLQFLASVHTAKASRYSLQAVVFAQNTEGRNVPVQLIQSSRWIEKGDGEIVFSVDPDKLQGWKPPYYLGNIRLLDLAQLKPVFSDTRYHPLDDTLA